MLGFLKNLFQSAPKPDFATLISQGAIVLDVRTKGEYQGGHVKGSMNIPLDQLSNQLGKLKKDKVIITCCASGMRSGSARRILQGAGFKEVHNGGSWMNVNRYC